LHGLHTPCVLPSGAAHLSPGQQSASLLHAPHAGTHALWAQTYGGTPPGAGFGTQGRPLQQLALEAHAPPGGTHCRPAQRGTPTESGLQVSSVVHDPLQQSQAALQDTVAGLQISPSGLQPCGLRQVPTALGGPLTQMTGAPASPGSPAEPQQSLSFVQMSPTTWQPLAGRQTSMPVGP
jgi:hypothetical protein